MECNYMFMQLITMLLLSSCTEENDLLCTLPDEYDHLSVFISEKYNRTG